jgi:2-phosphoglycerate kinase
MAAGLGPARAYHVAETVERALHATARDEISSSELRELTAHVLEEEVGPRYGENYRRWQRAQERTVPLIVLIGGATGVGKSTVATTVASRLGIVRIVSTDAIREVMRGILTEQMMPSLHTSSFGGASAMRELPSGVDPVIAGFRQQVHAVSVGVTQIIRRAVLEGTDLIIEGVHLVPGYCDMPTRDQAIVAPMMITVDDVHIHQSHFVARAHEARRRGDRRYHDHFTAIRAIQDYGRALAIEHGVPVVPSYSLDATVSRVMELVVAATTHPPRPGRSSVTDRARAGAIAPAPTAEAAPVPGEPGVLAGMAAPAAHQSPTISSSHPYTGGSPQHHDRSTR